MNAQERYAYEHNDERDFEVGLRCSDCGRLESAYEVFVEVGDKVLCDECFTWLKANEQLKEER